MIFENQAYEDSRGQGQERKCDPPKVSPKRKVDFMQPHWNQEKCSEICCVTLDGSEKAKSPAAKENQTQRDNSARQDHDEIRPRVPRREQNEVTGGFNRIESEYDGGDLQRYDILSSARPDNHYPHDPIGQNKKENSTADGNECIEMRCLANPALRRSILNGFAAEGWGKRLSGHAGERIDLQRHVCNGRIDAENRRAEDRANNPATALRKEVTAKN